jgi:hypothetical protein
VKADGISFLNPLAQFMSPSLSFCPSLFPEKQIRFGTPAAAAFGIIASKSAISFS